MYQCIVSALYLANRKCALKQHKHLGNNVPLGLNITSTRNSLSGVIPTFPLCHNTTSLTSASLISYLSDFGTFHGSIMCLVSQGLSVNKNHLNWEIIFTANLVLIKLCTGIIKIWSHHRGKKCWVLIIINYWNYKLFIFKINMTS